MALPHLHRRTVLTAALGTVVGCGAPLRRFPFDKGDTRHGATGLTIDFYGVTCFRLAWNNTAVLLGMGCANIEASGTPSIIDFIEPKTVLFCHWENFFRHKGLPPREIVKVDMAPLKKDFDANERFDYRFPGWDTRHFFADPPHTGP